MPRRAATCLMLLLLPATPSVLAQAGHAAHAEAPPTAVPRLGSINFPTSAPAPAQAEFIVGVLYLHSFEYESAASAFRRAETLDPSFALAYWGEAMTYTHPVWNQQDISAARGALERLAATAEARRAKAKTPRERAYLAAVETLYGSGSKARRDTLYRQAMERVVREYPADLEAKAFYALALLGLNQGIRDTSTYLRAARYADTVFRANPDHPGGAHYLIHSYDDPLHAARGLEAARAYARIAPDAAHAQHMTTHIFLALGMWDDVVAQNRIAVARTANVPGHYTSWLVYGLIQQGQYGAARAALEELRRNLSPGAPRNQSTALAELRAHFLLHSEDWDGTIARWRLERDQMTLPGKLTDTFTDGLIAYRGRDGAALSEAAAAVGKLAQAIRVDRGEADPATLAAAVMAREIEAMRLALAGSRESALRLLHEAAGLEDAMPMDFGPPAIIEPSHELLGSMLLEQNPGEALAQFRRALVLAPGRSRALLGVVGAAIAAGDKPAAQQSLERLAANWRSADLDVRAALTRLQGLVTRMP